MHRLPTLVILCLVISGCGNAEAQQAAAEHRAQLISDHQKEEDAAGDLLAAADAEPSLETLIPVLPLIDTVTLTVTFRGKSMDSQSAVRLLRAEHPELFRQALFHRLEQIAAKLPPEAEAFAPEQGRELHSYLKILVDAVSEQAMISGVPSVDCMVAIADGEGAERRLTVGYLYPFGEYRMGDSVVVTSANLPVLVADLRARLTGGES